MPAAAAASVTGSPGRGRGEGDRARDRPDMARIGDETAGQPGIGKRLTDHAWLAVMQRPLRIEKVGDHPGDRIRSRRHLPRGGIAVTDADRHPR